MTHYDIENKFDKMQLIYAGTAELRHTGNRVHRGYWIIPGEKYRFKIKAIEPRNTWAIEILHTSTGNTHLLNADMGILFIENVICDKFDFLGEYTWFKHQEQKINQIFKRLEFLTMYNIDPKYGKKDTKVQ